MSKTKNFSDSPTISSQRLSALAAHLNLEDERRAVAPTIDVDLATVKANPFQPRRHYAADALDDLAESIRRHGILQPLLGRREADGSVTLIAGHRRWLAAQQAGLTQAPIILRNEATDDDLRMLAVIENLQRDDLHAAEKARALFSVTDQFPNQEAAAAALGMKRAALSMWLRTRDLGDEILDEAAKLPDCSLRTLLHAVGLPPSRRLTFFRKRIAAAATTEPARNAPTAAPSTKSRLFHHEFRLPEKRASLKIEIRTLSRKTLVTSDDLRAALKDALARLDADFANALAASEIVENKDFH
jgi:ParB family transcriptional regulator, chromosome partitioning protein